MINDKTTLILGKKMYVHDGFVSPVKMLLLLGHHRRIAPLDVINEWRQIWQSLYSHSCI